MSTATIAFVRSVIAAPTAAGSRFSVRGSTSAKTGVAPSTTKQFADATNEKGEVIASSPGPSPAARASRCSPAVPLESETAYGAPVRSAISSSNRSIMGPSESRPERSTSSTSSSSRSPRYGRESGIRVAALLRARSSSEARRRAAMGGARQGRRERSYPLDTNATEDAASRRPARPGGTPLWRGTGSSGGRARGRVVEPLRPALALAAHRLQVRLLDLERDRPDTELVVVDRAKRRHLGGGAAHEHLVGEIEVGANEVGLLDRVPEVLRDLDDRVPRDPRKDRRRECGRGDRSVLDDEDVLA